jgi:hypothetical protein
MKLFASVLVAVVLAASMVGAEDSLGLRFIQDPTTQNLLALCDSNGEYTGADRGLCLGYVWGVFRGADLHSDSVLADGVTGTTLIATLRDSLIRQPMLEGQNKRLMPAHAVLIRAFIEAGLITFKPHPLVKG